MPSMYSTLPGNMQTTAVYTGASRPLFTLAFTSVALHLRLASVLAWTNAD